MAKDQFSFDVVSEVDLQEVRNAVDQAQREINTRLDFKDTGTALELRDDVVEVRSGTENRLKAAVEVLREKFVRRNISLKALQEGRIEPAARGTVRQEIKIARGISDEKARQITKFVKQSGVKVQAQVQKDQVRISGKKKDDLQTVISGLKEEDFGIPLQFTNYRP